VKVQGNNINKYMLDTLVPPEVIVRLQLNSNCEDTMECET